MSKTMNEESTDMLELLLTLKHSIMRDIHVATFAKVKSITTDSILVSYFPTIVGEQSTNIECVNATSVELAVNDLVYIVFADRNFLQSLKQAKLNQPLTELTDDVNLHTRQYGVIIAKLTI